MKFLLPPNPTLHSLDCAACCLLLNYRQSSYYLSECRMMKVTTKKLHFLCQASFLPMASLTHGALQSKKVPNLKAPCESSMVACSASE